jgi:hypothetical protein
MKVDVALEKMAARLVDVAPAVCALATLFSELGVSFCLGE